MTFSNSMQSYIEIDRGAQLVVDFQNICANEKSILILPMVTLTRPGRF